MKNVFIALDFVLLLGVKAVTGTKKNGATTRILVNIFESPLRRLAIGLAALVFFSGIAVLSYETYSSGARLFLPPLYISLGIFYTVFVIVRVARGRQPPPWDKPREDR